MIEASATSWNIVNETLDDRGYFVAPLDDLVTGGRSGSLMWITFGWHVVPSSRCRFPCLVTMSNASDAPLAPLQGSRIV
ncbi:hypothetical protein ACVWY3_007737 [Bradyrhizobium sp. USDA 4486]